MEIERFILKVKLLAIMGAASFRRLAERLCRISWLVIDKLQICSVEGIREL